MEKKVIGKCFKSLLDAHLVLATIRDYAVNENKGVLTVQDYYKIAGIKEKPIGLEHYGWSDLSGAHIRTWYDGIEKRCYYFLEMPEPVCLDEEHSGRYPFDDTKKSCKPSIVNGKDDLPMKRFKDLQIGETYTRMGDLFIKVSPMNAYNFSYNYLTTGNINQHALVQPVKVRITIEK